jgi:hypothetical protein
VGSCGTRGGSRWEDAEHEHEVEVLSDKTDAYEVFSHLPKLDLNKFFKSSSARVCNHISHKFGAGTWAPLSGKVSWPKC